VYVVYAVYVRACVQATESERKAEKKCFLTLRVKYKFRIYDKMLRMAFELDKDEVRGRLKKIT
jgi:hypothetical protein